MRARCAAATPADRTATVATAAGTVPIAGAARRLDAAPLAPRPAAAGLLQSRNVALARPGEGPGTLGALVRFRSSGAPLALTAGHVVGGVPESSAFDVVDISFGGAALGTCRLASWQPVFASRAADARLDAALLRIDAALAAEVGRRCGLPRGWADPVAGMAVTLRCCERSLRGRVVGTLASAYMESDLGLRYFLRDALLVRLDPAPEPGDSGAAYWDDAGRLVAIHAGSAPPGSDGNAIATPIRRILDTFAVDLVTDPSAVAVAPRTAPAPLPVLPPAGAVMGAPVPAPAAGGVQPNAREVDTLARTLYGEARREGADEMTAVCHVVLNRRDAARWWGRTVESVCLKPFQFSCWNEFDPNRRKLLNATEAEAPFATALEIARRLLAMVATERARADTTNGATHYHARRLNPLPRWARGRTSCAVTRGHVFYRGID